MARLVAVLAFLLQAQTTNDSLGYRFTVPPGFTPFPEGRAQQDVVDCWSENESVPGAMIFCVQRLRAVLPREAMQQQDLPAHAQLVSFRWKNFDIQGIRTLGAQNGQRVFVLVAQVPLRKEAVQLLMSGPADYEARGQTIMGSVLATLEGETNWLTRTERAERLGEAVGWFIGIGIGVVLVLIWRKRRQRARP